MDDPVMRDVDVLVDGEFHKETADVKLLWKGSANQRVIDVQATLKSANPLKPVLHCPDYAPKISDTYMMTFDTCDIG